MQIRDVRVPAGMAREWAVLGVFLLLLSVLLVTSGLMRRADLFFFDMVQPMLQRRSPIKVVLVAIGDESVKALGGWPVKRSDYAELIDRLTAAGAAAVGLDVAMPHRGRIQPGADERLAAAMKRNARVVVPLVVADPRGAPDVMNPVAPIAQAAFAIAGADTAADRDGVSRSIYLREGGPHAVHEHMSVSLLRASGASFAGCDAQLQREARRWFGACRRYVPLAPRPTYASFSFIDVLRGRIAPSSLKGAIVLVGPTSSVADTHFVAPGRERRPLAGVEFVAEATHALASGSLVRPASWAGQLLFTLSVLPFVCAALFALKARACLLASVALALAACVASLALLEAARVFFFPSSAVAVCVAAYALGTWRRQEALLRHVTPMRIAQRQRDAALRFLSHDIRSPQTAILALIEQRRVAPAELPETRFVDLVGHYAQSALALADEFLLLARAESQPPETTTVDLALLLGDAVDDLWPQASAKHTAVRLVAEPGMLVAGDARLLRRAFVNLIDNAIKFGPPGATVKVVADEREGHWAVSVADEGRGIPADQIPKLFTEFFREHADRAAPGYGLGLAFVKHVIDALGGQIRVESDAGRGSVFTLLLPKKAD